MAKLLRWGCVFAALWITPLLIIQMIEWVRHPSAGAIGDAVRVTSSFWALLIAVAGSMFDSRKPG